MIKKILKRIFGKIFLRKLHIFLYERNVVCRNVNNSNHAKSCLLLYVTSPFLNSDNVDAKKHQAFVQVVELAKILDDFGFNVDVIQFDNYIAKIANNYDLVIDLNPGLNNVYKNKLSKNAKRIAYFTGSENIFAYKAELARLENLKKRRGVKLPIVLNVPPVSKEVEKFDGVLFIGNEYNLQSFKNYKLPKTFLFPNTGYPLNIPFYESNKKTNSFIYFSSQGNVHRGLDLLLDIFSSPNFPCELYVCGPVESEMDFCSLYHHELYECKTIHLIGFIDITSKAFDDLCSKCCYSLLPSCSEAHAGSVLTMMSAGIIPIVSKECGYEDSEVINLPDCSIDTIKSYVIEYSKKEIEWCKEQSDKGLELVKTKYSMDSYRNAVRNGLNQILREKFI